MQYMFIIDDSKHFPFKVKFDKISGGSKVAADIFYLYLKEHYSLKL